MKKRKNTNKTISVIVNFYPSTQKEIEDLLNSLKISGVSVSNLISRWSIEVPFWKEGYYIGKLLESELVQKVFPSVKYGFYEQEQEQEQE